MSAAKAAYSHPRPNRQHISCIFAMEEGTINQTGPGLYSTVCSAFFTSPGETVSDEWAFVVRCNVRQHFEVVGGEDDQVVAMRGHGGHAKKNDVKVVLENSDEDSFVCVCKWVHVGSWVNGKMVKVGLNVVKEVDVG